MPARVIAAPSGRGCSAAPRPVGLLLATRDGGHRAALRAPCAAPSRVLAQCLIRALAIGMYNEGLWRLAMQAEGRLGNRDAISHRYQQLRELLQDQLGLEPERATRTLLPRATRATVVVCWSMRAGA